MFLTKNNREYSEYEEEARIKWKTLNHREMVIKEGVNSDSDIDDSLVDFGISDENVYVLLTEVTNGGNPTWAAETATHGVDQKGMANLITRIFAIAMKDSTGAAIRAAFDIVNGMKEISLLPSALSTENTTLVTCLKNIEKMSISGKNWENLPEMLAAAYIRWGARYCIAEILVKWLSFPSWDHGSLVEETKQVIGRQIKNTGVLLSKVGEMLFKDVPGRFVQLHQMAKKHLLSETCQLRSELLEIVIQLSGISNSGVVANEETGTIPTTHNIYQDDTRINHELDDSDTDEEETFSLADLGEIKQKITYSNSQKKIRLISPSQFESMVAIDYEEETDDINNNGSQKEIPFNPSFSKVRGEAKFKVGEFETGEKVTKVENEMYSKLEVEMAKLRLSVTETLNETFQKSKLFSDMTKSSEVAKDNFQAEPTNGTGDFKGPELLGHLETIDHIKEEQTQMAPDVGDIIRLCPKHLVHDGSCVGRMPSCQVTINGPKVSRLHAKVYKKDYGIFLQTLSNTNNCRVNRASVGSGKSIRIKTEDTIEIGGFSFKWFENRRDRIKVKEALNDGQNGGSNIIVKKGKGKKRKNVELGPVHKDVKEKLMDRHQRGSMSNETDINMKRENRNKNSKKNVALEAVLEDGAKKIKKSTSREESREYVKFSGTQVSVTTFPTDVSVSPPDTRIKSIEKKNHKSERKAPQVPSQFSFGEIKMTKFLPGKQFIFGSSQSQEKSHPKCMTATWPNISIRPPNVDIQIREIKEDHLQRKVPKVPSQFSFSGKKRIKPLFGKQWSSKMVSPKISISGQFDDYGEDHCDERIYHYKREDFKVKMPKMKQENDDVVIESERLL